MARLWQTGWEMGSIDIFDLTAQGSVNTSTTAGTWSTYSWTDAGTGESIFSLGSAVTEYYCGFRWQFSNNPSGSPRSIIRFNSPTPATQNALGITGGNALYFARGDFATTLATGTTLLSPNVWYYIEIHCSISATTGVVDVRINGNTEITLTSQNTKGDGASTTCDRIRLVATGGPFPEFFDDLYVNDTTGSQNTGFSGDIRISAYIPNAAGDSTGMTPTSGSNYANVDERPPNDATDIVAATGTTLYDLYNLPNTSGISSVQAVTLWLRAQKSDAGTKNVAHMIKSGSTENQGADLALSTSWTYYRKMYNNDPTDSAAWTTSKLDNLQVGQKAR